MNKAKELSDKRRRKPAKKKSIYTKDGNLRKLTGKKYVMYEALRANLGCVTNAVKKAKVARCTHYEWLKKDPLYKEWCSNLPDLQVDFYETALNRLVQAGNPAAIIFALKAKGKKRGWIERTEQDIRDRRIHVRFTDPNWMLPDDNDTGKITKDSE